MEQYQSGYKKVSMVSYSMSHDDKTLYCYASTKQMEHISTAAKEPAGIHFRWVH